MSHAWPHVRCYPAPWAEREPVDAVALGTRLREVRRSQGLSLHDVEARSESEFKASVLGAYERGERAISAARLIRLAEVYAMTPAELFPPHERDGDIDLRYEERPPMTGWTLDLTRLASLSDLGDPALDAVSRFATTIASRRRDVTEHALTLRDEDVWAISTALGTDRAALLALLRTLGASPAAAGHQR